VLDVLRKKKQSFLINGLLLVIVGVFIFWGIGSGIADRVEVVATVNGDSISRTELERVADNLGRSFRQMNPNAVIPPELVRSQALEQLITARLFHQEAEKLGLETTDAELRDAITRISAFQVQGRFDKEQYLRTLQANRRSPADFEEAQRDQVLSTKLQDLITAGAHVSNEDVRQKYRHDNERINVRYIRVYADRFKPEVTLSDGDIETYYNANKENFREPERARIEYVLFDVKSIAAQINPSDEDIRTRYDANPDDYQKPEEVHARHILFKVAPTASPEEKEAARNKAADVLKQLEAGGDFAALAQKNSEDGTASAGGDLGWFGRGRMVAPFEQAAFALAPGAMSQIVESPFGFHIIKVEEKRAAGVESLEEARPKIIEAVRSERAREEALKAAEAAHDRLTDRVDLNTIASEAKLTVQTPPPFAANEPIVGLGNVPDLVKMILETPAGETGDIANVDAGYALYRVQERIDSHVPELATIKDKIQAALRTERAQAQAKERAEGLLKQLQQTKDLDALGAEAALKVDETGPIDRRGPYVQYLGSVPALKNDAFALTMEAPIAPTVYPVEGDSVIVMLKERLPADDATFAQQEKSLTEQSRHQVEGTLLQQFVNHLKANAKIEIDPSYGGSVGG
jgi:peptidyl-prolyl cis-trans isomerase D